MRAFERWHAFVTVQDVDLAHSQGDVVCSLQLWQGWGASRGSLEFSVSTLGGTRACWAGLHSLLSYQSFQAAVFFEFFDSGLYNFPTFLLWLGQLSPHTAGSVPFSGKAFLGVCDIFLGPL